MREIAKEMADELIDHQCELDDVTRTKMLSQEEVLVGTTKQKR